MRRRVKNFTIFIRSFITTRMPMPISFRCFEGCTKAEAKALKLDGHGFRWLYHDYRKKKKGLKKK